MKTLIDILKNDKKGWQEIAHLIEKKSIPPKTCLLREGEVAKNVFFIEKGCLRQSFNKDGKDITFQFFFENQTVSSFDSFYNDIPSIFSIESLEQTFLLSIPKPGFETILKLYPEFKSVLFEYIIDRFSNYTQLFLSRIKDTPQERYDNLIKSNPEIIKRVPQHYIASYLGITSVSLSRIRNRK